MIDKKVEVKEQESALNEYMAQTKEDEDVHFEHYDWTYNDGSCCC